MKLAIYKAADQLYRHCFPVYRVLYDAMKRLTGRREIGIIRRVVKPGMVVLDIGSNIGFYTELLADIVGAQGHVHGFEPSSRNFGRLRKRVGSLGNVTVNEMAVGGETGVVSLYLSTDLNVDNRAFDSGEGWPSVRVPVTTVDDYCDTTTPVGFMKIDVQGYEPEVLRGAQRVLRENEDIVVLAEYWPYGLTRAGADPSGFLETLRNQGFQIRAVADLSRNRPTLEGMDPNDYFAYCDLVISRNFSIIA